MAEAGANQLRVVGQAGVDRGILDLISNTTADDLTAALAADSLAGSTQPWAVHDTALADAARHAALGISTAWAAYLSATTDAAADQEVETAEAEEQQTTTQATAAFDQQLQENEAQLKQQKQKHTTQKTAQQYLTTTAITRAETDDPTTPTPPAAAPAVLYPVNILLPDKLRQQTPSGQLTEKETNHLRNSLNVKPNQLPEPNTAVPGQLAIQLGRDPYHAYTLGKVDLTSREDVHLKTKNNSALKRRVYIALFAMTFTEGNLEESELIVERYVHHLAYINENPVLGTNLHRTFGKTATINSQNISQKRIDEAWEEAADYWIDDLHLTLYPIEVENVPGITSMGPIAGNYGPYERKYERMTARLFELQNNAPIKVGRPVNYFIGSREAWTTHYTVHEKEIAGFAFQNWERGREVFIDKKTGWDSFVEVVTNVDNQNNVIMLLGALTRSGPRGLAPNTQAPRVRSISRPTIRRGLIPTPSARRITARPLVPKVPVANNQLTQRRVSQAIKRQTQRVDEAGRVADDALLSASQKKSIRSLQKRIVEHQKKLAEFKANPTIRPGMEKLSDDVIRAQHKIRIEHLKTEIRAFKNNIQKILSGELK